MTLSPAKQLKGKKLEGGWTVLDFALRKPNATGSHFSQGYIVAHGDGRRGFLKALDYTAALQSPDSALALQAMVNAYLFEKALCEKCQHLSRIARAVASGATKCSNPFDKVEYLIFELADGDIRSQLDAQQQLDTVFIHKMLHGVATALSQLHNANIAHQDLKPSNVLVFRTANISKICDLGRAWDKNSPAPHDTCEIAGDSTYAPPELYYRAIPDDERARRFGCDLYHLGSLIVFCFARVNINSLLAKHLADDHLPGAWGGTYAEVLPYLHAAMDEALNDFRRFAPEPHRNELVQFVAELCNPDPHRRGRLYPYSKGLHRYALSYYVSRFDRFAHEAQLYLIKSKTSA